jgi:hypothetical protein
MLTPLSSNPENTVGICESKIPHSEYIGKFDAWFLKDFAELIIQNYGGIQVYLYCHKSDDTVTTAKALCASSELGEGVAVVVLGVEDKEDLKEYMEGKK